MSSSFEFSSVDRFTTGTVGPKGQRTFFLQAGRDGELVSFKLEKMQVSALAEYFDKVLEDLPAPDGLIAHAHDMQQLHEPVISEWVVAQIGVAYDSTDDRVVVQIEEMLDEDDDPDDYDDPGGTARFLLTRAQVRQFVDHAREVIGAGRPPCGYCGRPLDHDDGWCVCSN